MKKRLIYILGILIIILIIIFGIIYVSRRIESKHCLENTYLPFAEKNEETIFSINQCLYFSSSDAKNKNITQSNYTIENLYQYTDMAFYINNNSSENSLKNTLKSVYINNISFETKPEVGEPKLYYKNINNFAKSETLEENLIENELHFNITSEDTVSLDTPTLYNNLANPIVISYVNSNIKNDYTLTDTTSAITYDGSLLKKCSVLLSTISCEFSFDIYITNNLDEEFKCKVHINIPLEDNGNSIYDGKLIVKKDTNYTFYRYK